MEGGLSEQGIECKPWEEQGNCDVNLGKNNAIVSGGITKDGMSKSKADPCGFLKVKANEVLCLHCGMWILGKNA